MLRELPDALRAAIEDITGPDLAGQVLHDYCFDDMNILEAILARANLAGASFRAANVNGARFLHADLTRAVFDAARIHKCDFGYALLTGASCVDARISRADFYQTELSDADFTRATFLAVHFHKARLRATSLRETALKLVSFSGMALDGLDVTGARFDDVMFSECAGIEEMRADWILVGDDVFHERLDGARARAWLRAAALFHTGAAVRWTEAGQKWRREPELVPPGQRTLEALLARNSEAPFAGQRLTRAAVEWLIARAGADGGPLDLRGADLRHIYLDGLPLRGLLGGMTTEAWSAASADERERLCARFDGANFTAAKLEDAQMVGADFTNTFLRGSLDRADFSSAILTGATVQPHSAWDTCFTGVSAQGLDASFADLRGSNWRNASLVGARFHYAKLDGADFTGADLRDATFEGASTEGARFAEDVD